MIGFNVQSSQLGNIRAKATEIGQADNVARVGGRGVANYLRQWFFDLDKKRANKLGGKRTHFFGDVARSVQNPAVSNGEASVAINHLGLAQRWLGGIIRAGSGTSTRSGGPTKYLAIPANYESYGKTPAEFSGLEFFPTKRGGGLRAVRSVATHLKSDSKAKGARRASHDELGSVVLFWLVPEVTQKPDPSVMPDESALIKSAIRPMESYLSRRLAS
jgi:hypothetical protein